nr:uncharacterized protein LOC113694208 [Coffea arabica]
MNRILIDGGSAVNIMSVRAMKELGISSDELSQSRLMIQGFNQGRQRAIGLIRLELLVGELSSSALFHIIEAKTSYNMLLGRPWIHENEIIPSTLHQCFKYCRDGIVKKVTADDKPFTEVETHFADAKFYLHKEAKRKESVREESQDSKVPILRYTPKSKREEGQSSFIRNDTLNVPLTKIEPVKIEKVSLQGFVRPKEEPAVEHYSLPTNRTQEGFDPNAYRLLAKAGYNPNEKHVLGKLPPEVTGEKTHGLTPTQKMLKERAIMLKVHQWVLVINRPLLLGPQPKNLKSPVYERLGSKKQEYQVAREESLTPIKKNGPRKRVSNFFIHYGDLVNVRIETIFEEQGQESMASCHHITISDPEEEEEDADDAPPELEQRAKNTVDELKEINLGTSDDPRPIYISSCMTPEEEKEYVDLLLEFRDVFAWNYSEMPGLDPRVAVHNLSVKRGTKPVKQTQRRFRPELIPLIENEINRLIEAGFIREVKYPTWISSIVPVRKKNGQIRVCVDFRDLNEACPKDDFPLPITELTVDAATGHEALSFLDGSSGYNQIRMAPEDEELTAFRTPKGIYCYKVMPFGLKNAGATYQRAMQRIFDDMLHKNVECYVDDLVVKSKKREDHIQDLRKVFQRLRRYQLKMNPLKCAFGVTSGKFLGFIVHQRGIEVDRSKIDAIVNMPEPRNIHELKSLQGKLAYIRRFISNLAGRCQPFSRLMKKGVPFEWDESCRNAFTSIKMYLMNPPVLAAPIPGKPLILYISAQERSVGALLAQENDEGKENALYYLSRMMTPNELNYSPIEKLCLALIFVIQKLKHYFQAHTIRLISKSNPIKYVMAKPVLSDRLARWYLQFQQFEIIYVPAKAVKGQILADFLADHPLPAEWELTDELPDEEVFMVESPWSMYFDGAAHRDGAGAGVVFYTPEADILPYSFTLTRRCSNNVAEYQALILGLETAVDMKQLHLRVYGDSKLVVNQLLGVYDVKKPELIPYYKYARQLMGYLGDVTIEHIPRNFNQQADSLARVASMITLPSHRNQISICQNWVIPPMFDEDDDVGSYQKIPRKGLIYVVEHHVSFTTKGRFTEGHSMGCFYDVLEKMRPCTMEEAHSGICGAHQSGPKLHFRIKRMGYYWPTMVKDCIDFARRCQACQFHGNFIRQPPEPLHPTVASWPFDAWGLDIVGPLPKSSGGHIFILAATDYFSKWAEAVPLREVKKENVVDFIRSHIIYRYGVPRYIITDNGKPFCNVAMNKLCEKFHFKQYNSSMYYAAANGLAEAFNKSLCNLLKKIVDKSKRDWHLRIGEALWAYRTTFRTPTQATPYALVYGVEAVLPLECQIPSLRIAIQEGLSGEDNVRLRLEELEALDEKRLEAQQRIECYQARLSKAFNKHVRPRSFQIGELVLAVRKPIILTHGGQRKFTPKWDGPYVVREVYTNGSYKLVAENGLRVGPINGKYLKRYYA